MASYTLDNKNYFEVGILSFIHIIILGALLSFTFSYGSLIILALPILIASLMVFYRQFEFAVLLLLASSVLFLENVEGINSWEILYFSIVIFVFAATALADVIKGQLILNSGFDKTALVFVIILGYGILLGIINGGNTSLVLGELLYYFGFLGYFAYRKYLHKEWFKKTLLAVFVLILFYVAIRNIYYYREILIAAHAEWQAQKARTAANEVLLLIGGLGSISFILYSRRLIYKLLGFVVLAVFLGDLIITQSRGYWIAFLSGLVTIWILVNKTMKLQILLYAILMGLIGIITGYLFFNDLFNLVLSGIASRVESFLDLGAGNIGASLKERVLETGTVLEKIIKNPISGYGLGISFPRYYYLSQTFIDTSYVHNGYLAIWYKFGLAGLLTMLWFCWMVLKSSYKLYKKQLNPISNMIFLTIFSTLVAMLLVNNTSPQFFAFDSMLLLGLMAAFCTMYSEKYMPPIKTTS